jgi:hypothetical protein
MSIREAMGMKTTMSDPKQARSAADLPPVRNEDKLAEIQKAIFEGFGEYRRQIAEIRASHGKEKRKSLLN